MESFLGTILMWAGSWAPVGWHMCDGTLLPISSNTPLYSLLGTTYGGDGRVNFALPNLCGRMPMGAGSGAGLTPRRLGDQPGAESAPLTANNLPAHSHTMTASTNNTGLTQAPAAGWTLGGPAWFSSGKPPVPTAVDIYGGANPTNAVQSAPSSIAGSTSPAPVATIPPGLCINYIICLQGIFPVRP